MLSDGTQIDNSEYLESLENSAELIVCKISIYFELKRYMESKNISYPLEIDYFLLHLLAFLVAWLLFNFDEYLLSSFVEAVLK